ncbi:hypothetical protein OSB04_004060 [Centaurea solstitialis]|uniref:Poly [ADP-ribose] polymerase n=1 Tax=Centaurea solstitialis TaxID=347529 RepID=A0AA38TWC2_9ASTR|nr:hypothetical protein OSB04_004060 [Centaurea solstitialis]
MSRSSSFVNEDQDFDGDDFSGDPKVIDDDIVSKEESYDDADDEDVDADAVSDRESFTFESQIVDSTKIHPQLGLDDDLVGSNEGKVNPVDEPNNLGSKAGVNGLIRLNENDGVYETVRKRFISGMEDLGVNAQIEHIYRNPFNTSAITHARLQTFLIYAKAVKHESGNDQANIRYAWFGASKDDIEKIILHGFSHDNIDKDGAFGYGLYLCTDNSLIESVKSSTVDDEGTKHILLCRVIFGKAEVVKPGSKQCHPSSNEFQLGVDNLEFPKKLIIWRPEIQRVQLDEPITRPWMPIKALVSGLSNILPPEAAKKLDEYHHKYIEHKISRHDMLLGFREVAGDRLLLRVVKDYKEQQQLKEAKGMDSKANRLFIK